ncbi:uncharacterized mitochondrial protein AtMg00810-like [Miscanthus floridulus]|uniref:uncharacterized mitochondrial protein AtMg00810-like n=1 Tax=Miscanthus floridulus TaxID=154761 RepID=UPI003459A4AE
MAYLLLYVDDIILTASFGDLLCSIVASLTAEFSMKDLRLLHHFLGTTVSRSSTDMFLSQWHYILELLERAGMTGCKPCSTPIDTNAKLSADGPPVANVTDYWALAAALQYLTFTRPDISYAVQQICLYMHDPREPHLALIKRVLRYIKGTLDYGLQLLRSSTCDLVAYSDAD